MQATLVLLALAVTVTVVWAQKPVVVSCDEDQQAECKKKCEHQKKAVTVEICTMQTKRNEKSKKAMKCECGKPQKVEMKIDGSSEELPPAQEEEVQQMPA